MKVQDIMTKDPSCVTPDATVREAAQVMGREDVGIVPVIAGESDKKLLGVVTDRDIALRVVAEGREPDSTKVAEIASQNLATVDPQQDIDEALRLMAEHQVRRLPVVEEDGRLVGILAQADVARHLDASRTGEVVEQISE